MDESKGSKGLLRIGEMPKDGQSKHIILITYILHAYILYVQGRLGAWHSPICFVLQASTFFISVHCRGEL